MESLTNSEALMNTAMPLAINLHAAGSGFQFPPMDVHLQEEAA